MCGTYPGRSSGPSKRRELGQQLDVTFVTAEGVAASKDSPRRRTWDTDGRLDQQSMHSACHRIGALRQVCGEIGFGNVDEILAKALVGLQPPNEEVHATPERLELLKERVVHQGAHLTFERGVRLRPDLLVCRICIGHDMRCYCAPHVVLQRAVARDHLSFRRRSRKGGPARWQRRVAENLIEDAAATGPGGDWGRRECGG
jgi:hypothetical protein